jgi:dGTPase
MPGADRKNKLYSKKDYSRLVQVEGLALKAEPYRSSFRRDYARLLHSAAFRRLQGKKQLFPGHESDFFRNRLTHSLEVAQIAKSIAIKINWTEDFFKKNPIDVDLIEFAALAHDLGHPPFGHNGEEALDECMENSGGFEGNAQTLRILSRLEKRETYSQQTGGGPLASVEGKDQRAGLNTTCRSLASILKYDRQIPRTKSERDPSERGAIKGFYYTEAALVKQIKENVDGTWTSPFKTIECSIMDVADDIAYSTYDLEDAFKAQFLTPVGILKISDDVLIKRVCKTITDRSKKKYSDMVSADYEFQIRDFYSTILDIFGRILADFDGFAFDPSEDDIVAFLANAVSHIAGISDDISCDGYYRTGFTSEIVGAALAGVEVTLNKDHPSQSQVRLNFETFKMVEVLKNLVYQSLIMSPMLKVTEYRGKKIIHDIFDAIAKDDGYLLMPSDFQKLYFELTEPDEKKRIICDFISGMTDRYAMQFYNRLFGSVAETIYAPI